MEELSKLEALWSEIRQSQYLTEENIKRIDNLIEELKSLNSSNSTTLSNLTELYSIINKLLLNLQAVNKNFDENVSNLDKTIKNSINNIDISKIQNEIENKIYDLKKTIQNKIKLIQKELQTDLNETNSNLKNNITNLKSTNKDLNETNNKIKESINNLNKAQNNLNEKVKSINYKLLFTINSFIAIAGVAGGFAISQFFLYKYEFKKAIELGQKIERKKATKIIKDLTEKNAKLKFFKIPNKYLTKDKKGYYIDIPCNNTYITGGAEYKTHCYVPLH